MTEFNVKVMIDGDTYSQKQLEFLEYMSEKHNLQEIIHLGAEVTLDGRPLSYEDINYLSMDDSKRALLEIKKSLGTTGIREVYKDSIARSNQTWKNWIKNFTPEQGYKSAEVDLVVEGLTIVEFQKVLERIMAEDKDGTASLTSHPDHFPTMELEGFAPNERNSLETMGMYGGPVDTVVVFDNSLELPAPLIDGYRLMTGGTSKLLDGTPRYDLAAHQLKLTEDGFMIKGIIYFPACCPDELVEGHKIHLATEFSEGVKEAYANRH